MIKRVLSLLLCLIMVLSFGAPAVQASDVSGINDIYIEEGSTVTGADDSTVLPTEPMPTEPTQPEQVEVPPVQIPVADAVNSGTVACDCGANAEKLLGHSDGCQLKKFCIELCAKSAMDIYSDWYALSTAEREFIKEYLTQHYPDTLDALQKIWNGDMIADENDSIDTDSMLPQQETGQATAQVDGIIVGAHGIPEGSSLTVTDPSKNATEAVEETVSELGANPEQLFFYDISVQSDESDNWQPQTDSVYMTLSVPGLKLHKYETVYVVHVDDDGNSSVIEASVNENGDIAFFTDGFSTFAGFTVDFKYGSAFFSIDGKTDIKLSALLDELKMPLYASDVTDLRFSDETLISVTRLEDENDWLLTSLKEFRTQEVLTLTMNDGNVYEISVTDASAFIWVGGGDYGKGTRYDIDGNQFCGWYADGDGDLATQNTYGFDGVPNDGWKETNTIYFSGSGTFEIGIYPYTNVYSRERAYIRLNQIKVGSSVNLKIYLDSSFDSTSIKEVRLQARSTSNLFIIEDGGSLELQGRAATSSKSSPCYLVLDGWNDELRTDNSSSGISGWGLNDYTKDNQLIQMCDGARGLTCNYVQFEDAHRSAIRIRNGEDASSNNRTQTFRLTNCIFTSDVCRENTANDPATGSGGAIYLEATGSNMSGGTNYTWMDELYLENCTFNGCWAAESGGALGIYGCIKDITVKDCDFNSTYSKRGYGGAIVMAGHASTMTITGTTFDNCSSTEAGGAIYVVSRVLLTTNNTYSRLNELTISDCTFKNSGTIANGQTINSSLGGAISLDSSINKVSISDSTFTDLKATEGGGICFGYTNLTATNGEGEHAYMSNESFNTTANSMQAPPGDEGTSGSTYYRTTICDTTITNCDFTRVTGETQGGGIRFRTNSTVKSVSMDDVNFDSCEAVQAGSAVMLGDTIIPSFTYQNSVIKNCKTTLADSSEVGGSFRTIGKTTCNASLTNIQFLNNASHCSGGGIYWNAAGMRYITSDSPITTKIAVDQCTFDGNTAGWYGGGIYCESVMTVTKCELKNNVAIKMGGGIALQLYNNTVRPFTDGETTNLTLDSQTNIHHNQSKVGGGLSIRANASQAVANNSAIGHTIQFGLGGAQVHHNYATGDGGGVWFNVETYDTSTEAGAGNQQEVERFNKAINLVSGSIYSNTAGGNGGGVYMNGGVITDPDDTSTGTLTSNGTVTINLSGAAIYDNEAGRSCTGVTATEEDVLPPVITSVRGEDGNIQFTKSDATGGNGGGIYLYGNVAVCNLTGGVVGAMKNADGTPGTAYKNIATRSVDASAGGNGGGIAIFGSGRIVMEGGFVVNNMAETAGGGISVHDHSSMHLTNGQIHNNQACIGGGISLNNAKSYDASAAQDQDRYGLYLDGGTISDNKVIPDSSRNGIAYGGGICISGTSSAKINNGLITQNVASSTVEGITFEANQEGGGVAACEGGELTIAGGTISENKAYDGGGIVIRGSSDVIMSGSLTVNDSVVEESSATGVIKKNYAYHDAGGVYLGPYKGDDVNHLTMNNGWIYDNDADTGKGGGVYVSKYNGFYLNGGYIDDNSAQSDGGAVFCTEGVVEITDGVIQNNVSEAGSGGAVYMINATKLHFSNGTIQNNKTLGNQCVGGAIYADNTPVTISNGTIQGNSTEAAQQGHGGAIYATGSTLNISNGIIQNNIAKYGNGGGIYINGGKLIFSGNASISGSLLNNKAPNGCGGGIAGNWVTQVDIDYLHAEGNSGMYGGGIYLEYCSDTTIDGGVFTKNYSNQGAGLFIRSGKSTITGGEFTWNVAGPPRMLDDGTYEYKADNAAQHGGGIVIDDLTTAANDSWVKILGGEISHNTAPNGGGIWLKNISSGRVGCCPNVIMEGGNIVYNTANYGGGVYVDGNGYGNDTEKTTFTIEGGNISYNTANGYGGGVYATGKGNVNILENDTTGTHGTISYNTAHCGGGIGVGYGATLTVNNGYITYNTAFVPAQPAVTPAKTGYQQVDALYGAGGGIFVVQGYSDAVSTFTLTGDNMAVYGNEAGYCADDVFSNGSNTKLNMPLVSSMNLAGYGFNPEGWVEDYNPGDANYANSYGLNMFKANGAPEELHIQRYRNANGSQRRYALITVSDDGNNYVRGNEDVEGAEVASYNYVNKDNAYVAMTLGIPGAVDDTIVVDYGHNVNISLIDNDLFMDGANFDDSGELGLVLPDGITNKDGILYSSAKDGADHMGSFYGSALQGDSLKYGVAFLKSQGVMLYDIGYDKTDITFDEPENMVYTVKHGDNWFYANIKVIPATAIYYEDNEDRITYHTESANGSLAQWKTDGSYLNDPQDQDRPGTAMIEGLDADNIYGYDSSYANISTYSKGEAHWVTVTRDPVTKKTTSARATFTFKGTGFDLISLCSKNTGSVVVSVYQGEVTDFDNPPYDRCVAAYMVDTHYGYEYNEESGKWELNEDSTTTLYQVPVIKADLTKVMIAADDPDTPDVDESVYKDYGYDTYTVEIYVAPGFLESEPGYWSSDFYLDGIRIYNPAGIGDSVNQDALKAYEEDEEAWPAYAELRNMFISQKDLGVETTEGVIFIDGKGENVTLGDYTSWGPNNEIYLNPGEHIAFTMDMSAYGQDVTGIHVAMRGLTGMGSVRVQAGSDGSGKTTLLRTSLSATDLYYNIGQKDDNGGFIAAGKVVVITNPEYVLDANGNYVIEDGEFVENKVPISISNVKVTHGTMPSNKARISGLFTNSLITGYTALDILTAEELVDPIVTPKRPALSFNGMVSYNVFFSAENLGDLTGADLGLAVFSTEDANGTVETAREVVMGAAEVDGLYMVSTGGIHAKYLGDRQYFRVFAKRADGSYVYSKMVSYSAVDYAKNVLAKSSDVKLKQLVVAMLNYGAEAQKFFGYKTEDLMNKDLTADDQALVADYDASFLKSVSKADPSKVGVFASTGGFSKKSPAISFKGAFEINYFFTPANTVDGNMKLYFWNEDTYNSVTELTVENADKAVDMALENGSYTATSDEIAAKYLDRTVYVAAVYESNGITYCSGVLPYSIAAYCQNPPAGVQALATVAAIYGGTAKQYFGA